MSDSWASGNTYERFMGRWSTLIARGFLEWLAAPSNCRWLDVGCGTGSLTRQILEFNQPMQISAVDSSADFISHARQAITDPSVRFEVGDASALNLDDNMVDVVVSGLMLNFVPKPRQAIREMLRVARPGGSIGIFLWDYAGGMEMLRYFWDAAVDLDPTAEQFDEGIRFPLCGKGQLDSLAREAGLEQIEATAIEVPTVFQNFDDYWSPFLGKVGPAPSYAMSLDERERQMLRKQLRQSLPIDENASIPLTARAWGVKGLA